MNGRKLFSRTQDRGGFDDELYDYIVQRKVMMENDEIDSLNGYRYDLFGDIILMTQLYAKGSGNVVEKG